MWWVLALITLLYQLHLWIMDSPLRRLWFIGVIKSLTSKLNLEICSTLIQSYNYKKNGPSSAQLHPWNYRTKNMNYITGSLVRNYRWKKPVANMTNTIGTGSKLIPRKIGSKMARPIEIVRSCTLKIMMRKAWHLKRSLPSVSFRWYRYALMWWPKKLFCQFWL